MASISLRLVNWLSRFTRGLAAGPVVAVVADADLVINI